MAIANIVCRGYGFNPGSTQFIPTLGFGIGDAPTIVSGPWDVRFGETYVPGMRKGESTTVGGRRGQAYVAGISKGEGDV